MAIGKTHAIKVHMLAVGFSPGIGQSQPERKRTVAILTGHASLASRCFIATAQHEERVAARTAPVGQPFVMGTVTVLFQVELRAEQFAAAEAEAGNDFRAWRRWRRIARRRIL